MSLERDAASYYQVATQGPSDQYYTTVGGLILPFTIAASATYTSPFLENQGYRNITVGVIGTNAGTFGATVGLTRYIDPGQVIQQHTIAPVALVSGSNAVTFNDDLPYIGFTFYIQNTGTGIMTVTALGILFSSV